jgi:hypothetical protein
MGLKQSGMKELELRDYFASQALALMANPDQYPEAEKVAEYAYKVADAMLRQRGTI